MSTIDLRTRSKRDAIKRPPYRMSAPKDSHGHRLRVSQYFGADAFDFRTAPGIPDNIRREILDVSRSGKKLKKEHAEVVAKAVTEWALGRGATHFCHWFQPLTGNTAEKHDAFLDYDKEGRPIEKLSATQLMQGEPDASSFPHGGSRATFEARGYTTWDLTSPMFLIEGTNGKTLCIPTAFVSYRGEALDIKAPLLRSINKLDKAATRFLNLIGEDKVTQVHVTCGAEQEYFLVDKAFYYSRPDLVMTGKTMFGSLTARNQQLNDHYFGSIPSRVLGFMEELDYRLHLLGIPAKTRHNEVAPGQFEIAQIFRDANISADNNQLLMATIKTVAEKHDFVALLHEKPFAGINGSGKHLNWSMADSLGNNLLEPGDAPHANLRFLAVVSMIVEALYRHAGPIRMAIAGRGNDHRLGANEAPPSIMSAYLGDTLEKIFNAILEGKTFLPEGDNVIDIGASQLANLLKDNTDRNRTSPFAFTGNKFEFRAVGSSQAVGFPLSILNAAVAEVIQESCDILETDINAGKNVDEALEELTKKWIEHSHKVIFNGDGYSDDWLKEAQKRGLPNYRTTPEALAILKDERACAFLTGHGIYRKEEISTRYNVLLENYNTWRMIEFRSLTSLVSQNVIPSVLRYKSTLGEIIKDQKEVGVEASVEKEIYKKINFSLQALYSSVVSLENELGKLGHDDERDAQKIAGELLPLSEKVAEHCNELEDMVPTDMWTLPTYYDMLFLR